MDCSFHHCEAFSELTVTEMYAMMDMKSLMIIATKRHSLALTDFGLNKTNRNGMSRMPVAIIFKTLPKD